MKHSKITAKLVKHYLFYFIYFISKVPKVNFIKFSANYQKELNIICDIDSPFPVSNCVFKCHYIPQEDTFVVSIFSYEYCP